MSSLELDVIENHLDGNSFALLEDICNLSISKGGMPLGGIYDPSSDTGYIPFLALPIKRR